MTQKQLWYFDKKLWPAYTRILRSRGYTNADLVQERDDLYIRALGERISSRKWTTQQFNRVLQELNLVLQPANLNAAGEPPEQMARRALYRSIMNLGFPPEYLEGILFRSYSVHDLDELTIEQLRKFHQIVQKAARQGYAKAS